MKKIITVLAISMLIFGLFCTTAQAAPSNIKVVVDGKQVVFTDAKPYIDSNYRTQVPMRALGEALGCEVNYTKDIYQGNGHENIKLTKMTANGLIWNADLYRFHYTYPTRYSQWSKVMTVNIQSPTVGNFDLRYQTNELDTTPQMKNNRTYLPARYAAEAFGYYVTWDAKTSTVIIKTDPTKAFHIAGSEGYSSDYLKGKWEIVNYYDGAKLEITSNAVKMHAATFPIKSMDYDPNSGAAYFDLGNGSSLSFLLEGSVSATAEYLGIYDAEIFHLIK